MFYNSLDLAVPSSPWAADFSISSLGQIDVLVNNAGITVLEPTLEITAESVDKLLGLNYRAPILLTKILANHMLARQWPSITLLMAFVSIASLPVQFRYESRGTWRPSIAVSVPRFRNEADDGWGTAGP